jgi:hypothetical protein
MEYLHLNLSDAKSINNIYSDILDIGTESAYEPKSIKKQNGGANFLDIFKFGGNTNGTSTNTSINEQLALTAAEEKNYEVVKFLINHNNNYDFSQVDKSNNTLLHHIARDYTAHNIDPQLIKTILSDKNVKQFINIQNIEGDTPAITALKNGNNNFVNMLRDVGADLTITNKIGQYIASSTDTATNNNSEKDIDAIDTAVIMNNSETTNESQKDIIERVVNTFIHNKKPPNNNTITESIGFNNISKASPIAKTPVAKTPIATTLSGGNYNNHSESQYINLLSENHADFLEFTEGFLEKIARNNTTVKNTSNLDTENILSKLNEIAKSQDLQHGGKSVMNETENSELFLNNLINKYSSNSTSGSCGHKQNNLQGGNYNSKNTKSVKGTRKLLSYKRYNDYGITPKSEYSEELGTLLNNQADQIRSRVLKRVKNVTNSTLSDADNYVSYMENIIDEQFEGNSNLDKKVELENMVSKSTVVNKFKEASEIHKEVVEKIKKVLKTDNDEEARDYKAALWNMAKEKYPDSDNLEQSKEMKKMATKKVLDGIDLAKAKELRSGNQKRRQERRDERKQKSSSISETSTAQVDTMSNISETSYTNSL